MIPCKVKEMIKFLTSLIIILKAKANYKAAEILFNALLNQISSKSQAKLLKIYSLHSKDWLRIFLYRKVNPNCHIKRRTNWQRKNIQPRDFNNWANQERWKIWLKMKNQSMIFDQAYQKNHCNKWPIVPWMLLHEIDFGFNKNRPKSKCLK